MTDSTAACIGQPSSRALGVVAFRMNVHWTMNRAGSTDWPEGLPTPSLGADVSRRWIWQAKVCAD